MNNNEQLQIEEFKTLLESMHNLCDIMPQVIFTKYFNENKYLYSLYFEAFNSIKGFCVLLGNGALISQSCTVLRMAIEHTATIKILEMHKELFENYVEHQKFRFEIRNEENKKELIKEHYKNVINSKDNPLHFLEYGWLKPINEDYSISSLIELSEIQKQDNAIQNWKNELNYWTHGIIQFTNLAFDEDNPTRYSHELILLAAKLLVILIREFHNENKFDFKVDRIDYRVLFLDAYKAIKK